MYYRLKKLCNHLFLRNIQRCKQQYDGKAHHYCTASVPKLKTYTVGQQLHGYTVIKVEDVPEFSLTATLLNHDKTGAQHLHISREDTNNVFGVALRTTPMDHTGVPHILEHTALCGSQKYPVRDPFFKMLNRSLSTFMNAFTASDWTMYPFSTQNRQDYTNLMSVYLDAVFFPHLRETDFRQEGWRLEHENIHDSTSPIVFKGIVFNEMKGVFSNNQNWFAQKNQNLLLPDHTYATVSGGDPQYIPDLSWKQLRDFHSSHYHPSNSRFYTYGDLPLEQHLRLISEQALDKFSQIAPGTEVPPQAPWAEPRVAEITCSPDPLAPEPAKQTTVAVSYLLSQITDIKEATVLSILGHLLVGSEKAPFYRALLDAGLGSDLAPTCGYDGNTRQATFSVGLQGVRREDVDAVTAIVERTVDEVIENGFEAAQIDAILHRIELSQKHQSEKFGLNLGINVLPVWTHDGDAVEGLRVSELVQHFKQCLQDDPAFLQEKVRHYFKDNPHKLTLVMSPDEEFEPRRQQAEQDKLEQLLSRLSEADREEILRQGVELCEVQSREEDLSCLPTLRVADIQPQLPATDTQHVTLDGVPVQLCGQPCNGVTYFRAVANMAALPADLKPYVALFANVITKVGTGRMDYREQGEQIDLHTGGLGASPHVARHPDQLHTFEQGVLLTSYCLDHNLPRMLELWTDIFNSPAVESRERLSVLIQMTAAELASSLAGSGHAYAMGHAAASLAPAAALSEALSGLSQVALMKGVAERLDLDDVIGKLAAIAQHVFSAENLRCSLSALPERLESGAAITEAFLQGLPRRAPGQAQLYTTQEPAGPLEPVLSHYELPFQVNFVGRAVSTVPYSHDDFASLRVLARLMSAKVLHREIREKGGAYGGGAAAGGSGIFSFYSYRDPHSMSTLAAFDDAVEWVRAGQFSQQDVDEAKLAVFSQVDLPVAPGNRGQSLFLHGLSDETRQAHRQQLFDVTTDHLVQGANRYLSKESRQSSVTLLGPANADTAAEGSSWALHAL